MGGFFLIGGACGFLGALLGRWLMRRMLADPNRTGIVAMAFTRVLVVLGLGVTVAMRPTGRSIVD